MTKSEARKIYAQKRKSLTAKEKLVWDDLILIQFQKIILPPVSLVFSYIAMDKHNEVNTDPIVKYLEFANPGLRVAHPVCDFDSWTMDAVIIDDQSIFELSKFSTIEPKNGRVAVPSDIDLVIVPLLCFDKEGYRVGYGKGFYDKYFKNIRKDTIKIGLSYFDPIEKIDDRDEFDIPLDYCVTPSHVYELKQYH